MGSAFGDILPLGIAVAISPFPIVAVILLLFTSRAKSNAPAFLAGWIAGLVAVGAIVLVIASGVDIAAEDESWSGEPLLRTVAGAVLLALAARHWRRRPRERTEAEMPGWMRRVESVNPAMALGLGVVLSGLNPKDTTLTVLAAAAIARAGLSAAESALTLAVFIAIATLSVVAPMTVYFVLGDRAEATLAGWKAWLTGNNATVMAILFLMFGVGLLAQGVHGLTT